MKVAAIVLLCFVMLSVIYGCSTVWLNNQIQDIKPASSIEEIDFLKFLGIQSCQLQADAIDSPRPRIKGT